MTRQPQFHRAWALALAGAATLFLAACGTMGSSQSPQEVRTQAATERAQPLTDGEIVAVVHTLNEGEMRQAGLAMQKGTSADVRETAQNILDDHQAMDQRLRSMAASAGIQPQESALSRSLKQQADEMQAQLRDMQGSEFDYAYLQRQVQLHQLALDTIRKDLLPAAKNPQLREMLSNASPSLEHHLQEARSGLEDMKRG